jgi:hypothetical protein
VDGRRLRSRLLFRSPLGSHPRSLPCTLFIRHATLFLISAAAPFTRRP